MTLISLMICLTTLALAANIRQGCKGHDNAKDSILLRYDNHYDRKMF
jgi:hypothetical protein